MRHSPTLSGDGLLTTEERRIAAGPVPVDGVVLCALQTRRIAE
jgi:hypothetical protein